MLVFLAYFAVVVEVVLLPCALSGKNHRSPLPFDWPVWDLGEGYQKKWGEPNTNNNRVLLSRESLPPLWE